MQPHVSSTCVHPVQEPTEFRLVSLDKAPILRKDAHVLSSSHLCAPVSHLYLTILACRNSHMLHAGLTGMPSRVETNLLNRLQSRIVSRRPEQSDQHCQCDSGVLLYGLVRVAFVLPAGRITSKSPIIEYTGTLRCASPVSHSLTEL